MTDEQEHSRVRTVLDDVAEEMDRRTAEGLVRIRALKSRAEQLAAPLTDEELSKRGWAHTLVYSIDDSRYRYEGKVIHEGQIWTDLKNQYGKVRIPIDTDPRIDNSGKPLRIRGMVEDGKLTLPGEPKDG